MDTYSRLLAALPAESRRDFRLFAESNAFQNIIERGAAFELGRQVERQASVLIGRASGIRARTGGMT